MFLDYTHSSVYPDFNLIFFFIFLFNVQASTLNITNEKKKKTQWTSLKVTLTKWWHHLQLCSCPQDHPLGPPTSIEELYPWTDAELVPELWPPESCDRSLALMLERWINEHKKFDLQNETKSVSLNLEIIFWTHVVMLKLYIRMFKVKMERKRNLMNHNV